METAVQLASCGLRTSGRPDVTLWASSTQRVDDHPSLPHQGTGNRAAGFCVILGQPWLGCPGGVFDAEKAPPCEGFCRWCGTCWTAVMRAISSGSMATRRCGAGWALCMGFLLSAGGVSACGTGSDIPSSFDSTETEDGQEGKPRRRQDEVDSRDDIRLDDVEGEEELVGDCERELRLEAVKVGGPAPFDVVIVADHSDSLSWSRDDLARGLSKLLQQVRGHEVRFYVFTPTQYGATSAAARLPIGDSETVQWRDPETGEAYENAMTRYVQSCADSQGSPIECPVTQDEVTQEYTLEGNWEFIMPGAIAAITPAMSEEEVDAQKDLVSSAILNLGLGGSSNEQPVCTLRRYLMQEPEILPEHAVFLVLSDEDDTSDPEDCVVRFTVDGGLSEARNYFLIDAPGLQARRRFDCVPVNDQGEPVGEPLQKLWNDGECTTDRECDEDELARSSEDCPASHRMENCRIECEEGRGASCLIEQSEAPDACSSSFEYAGDTYENLRHYCSERYPEVTDWNECRAYESAGGSVSFGHRTHPLTEAADIPAMIREFRSEADEIFGVGGYAVKVIGFDPSFSCAPQTGQSYLQNLKGLVDSDEQIFPICEDYSGALRQVQDFATQLVENEYELALEDGETLEAVRVAASDGSVRELSEQEYVYNEQQGMLTVQPSALSASDSEIEINVRRNCVIR